jgi:hypothetical protein
MNFEMFIEDYHLEVNSLSKMLEERKEKGLESMKAETYQFNLDGTIEKVRCEVHSYDPVLKKFKTTFTSKEGT